MPEYDDPHQGEIGRAHAVTVIIQPMSANASRERPLFHALKAALPTALAIVLLLVAASWFSARWDAVRGEGGPLELAWGWLGVAFVLLVLHAGSAIVIWRSVLRAIGSELSWRAAIDTFVPSLLARYVPGKIWANTVRLALGKRAGVAYGASTGAILWETLIALGSAGCVTYLTLAFSGSQSTGRAALILIAGVVAAWLTSHLMARRVQGRSLLARFGGAGPARHPLVLGPSTFACFVGWVIYGSAHLAIARAIAPVTLDAWPLVTGAVALAWAGGYLAIIMPVGLGVRDGIILLLVAPVLDPAQALVFVGLSRVVQLAVDGSVTGVWIIRQWWRRSQAVPEAAPRA